MVAHKRVVPRLLADIDTALLTLPINVLRLSLPPNGLAPRIANLRQWRAHLFDRLRQQIRASGDAGLAALCDELLAYPVPPGLDDLQLASELAGVVVPLRLKTPFDVMSFISTTTIFGTPVDVTLQELAIETLFAADEITAGVLRGLAQRIRIDASSCARACVRQPLTTADCRFRNKWTFDPLGRHFLPCSPQCDTARP